jgi:hypothetical protein
MKNISGLISPLPDEKFTERRTYRISQCITRCLDLTAPNLDDSFVSKSPLVDLKSRMKKNCSACL